MTCLSCETVMKDGKSEPVLTFLQHPIAPCTQWSFNPNADLLGREAQLGLMPLSTRWEQSCPTNSWLISKLCWVITLAAANTERSAYSDGVSWPTSPLSLQSVSQSKRRRRKKGVLANKVEVERSHQARVEAWLYAGHNTCYFRTSPSYIVREDWHWDYR